METLNLIKNDPWLEPYADAINGRHKHASEKEAELTNKGKQTLSDFASGYLYFGLHRTDNGWVFREWAPNATQIFLIGTFNDWKEEKKYSLKRKANGNWGIKLPADAMKHGDLYKLMVHWDGGCGERIPAWANRVVQDEQTKIFSAQVWSPEKPYKMKKKTFKAATDPLLIYECHIGMAQEEEKVGSYREFSGKAAFATGVPPDICAFPPLHRVFHPPLPDPSRGGSGGFGGLSPRFDPRPAGPPTRAFTPNESG